MYELQKTPEFEEWLDGQPLKSKLQIEARLLHIVCDGHFGICKHLTDHVWEPETVHEFSFCRFFGSFEPIFASLSWGNINISYITP